MFRKLARLGAVVTLAVGLLVSPAISGSAEAAAKPKLKIEKVSLSGTMQGQKYSYTYSQPALSGVSKAVRKSVQSKVTAFFSAASPTGWGNEVCDLSGSTKGEIYKGRYLSVLMQWHGCTHVHSLKTLNIDLKTGKSVKLSKFVDNRKNVFWNVLNRKAGFDTSEVWRSWNVGSKGVKAYAFDGESWFYSVTVPWNKVLKPGKTAGKKKYSSKAPLRCMGSGKLAVTVQGALVTATYAYPGGATRFYGVRGSAKTTVAMTPKYSPSGGSTVKITFTSKSSKVAKSVTPLDFC